LRQSLLTASDMHSAALASQVTLSAPKIGDDAAVLAKAAQVHVGSFPAHHPQQPTLIVAARQARELDATAVGPGPLVNRLLRLSDNFRSMPDLCVEPLTLRRARR